MTREQLDQYSLDLLLTHNNILFEWATGCGKTKQAIKAIDLLDKTKPNKVLIVIAEVAHKSNWIDEFNKWGKELLNNINLDINIICYNSLHHYKDEHFDLVILDECHHIGTEIRIDILKSIFSDRFILLSATVDRLLINDMSFIIGPVYISAITLQNAIDWGLIPAPKIYLMPLELDNTICNQVIEEIRGKKDRLITIRCTVRDKWKYLKDKRNYPNLRLLISCTERQKYNDLDMKIDYYMKLLKSKIGRNSWSCEAIRNKMLQYGSQRKSFLGILKDKRAKEIISNFKECRYICFCSNIEQADRLGGSHAVHSKKDDAMNVINKFNNKEINSLFVVGMLKEGQNLKDIEKGLIIQLDGKIRAFIQKSGRILRAKQPEIYIIYFKGTQDEVYLNRALEGLNPEYIVNYENHN